MKKVAMVSSLLTIISIIIVTWSLLTAITMFVPGLIIPVSPQTQSASYDIAATLIKPFEAIDRLFPNPDNDQDGPFVLATLFLPLLAVIVSGSNYILEKKKGKVSRLVSVLFYTALALFLIPIILFIMTVFFDSFS